MVHGEAVRQWNALRSRPAILWGGSMSLACTEADTPDKPPPDLGPSESSNAPPNSWNTAIRPSGPLVGLLPLTTDWFWGKEREKKGSEWQIKRASRGKIYSHDRKGSLGSPYKEECRNHVLKFEEQFQKLLQRLCCLFNTQAMMLILMTTDIIHSCLTVIL